MKLFKNNRWLLIPILSSLLLLVLMKTVLFLGYVPTESMEPTLKKDSFILGTRLYGDLTDGDIIIFERDGRLLVKRITASGGEAVVRNGITLIVPENCYYVQGDNANHSYDSRFWSDPFVKESSIKAKLLGRFFISAIAACSGTLKNRPCGFPAGQGLCRLCPTVYHIAAKLVLVKMGGDKLSALCFFLQNTCAHICVLTVDSMHPRLPSLIQSSI